MCLDSTCKAPAVGVTVTFGGQTATTDQAGNFYVGAGQTPVTGAETDTQGGFMMSGSPAPAFDCNASGCHLANSTQTFPLNGKATGGTGSVYN
jgi:hypothetical protein